VLPGTQEYKSAPSWKSQVIGRSCYFLFIHKSSEVSWNFRKVHSEAKVIWSNLPYHESDDSGCRFWLTYQNILLYSNVYSIFLNCTRQLLEDFQRVKLRGSALMGSQVTNSHLHRVGIHDYSVCWNSDVTNGMTSMQRCTKTGQSDLLMPVINGQTDRHSYLANRVHNCERRKL